MSSTTIKTTNEIPEKALYALSKIELDQYREPTWNLNSAESGLKLTIFWSEKDKEEGSRHGKENINKQASQSFAVPEVPNSSTIVGQTKPSEVKKLPSRINSNHKSISKGQVLQNKFENILKFQKTIEQVRAKKKQSLVHQEREKSLDQYQLTNLVNIHHLISTFNSSRVPVNKSKPRDQNKGGHIRSNTLINPIIPKTMEESSRSLKNYDFKQFMNLQNIVNNNTKAVQDLKSKNSKNTSKQNKLKIPKLVIRQPMLTQQNNSKPVLPKTTNEKSKLLVQLATKAQNFIIENNENELDDDNFNPFENDFTPKESNVCSSKKRKNSNTNSVEDSNNTLMKLLSGIARRSDADSNDNGSKYMKLCDGLGSNGSSPKSE